jgi:hypothetical protein
MLIRTRCTVIPLAVLAFAACNDDDRAAKPVATATPESQFLAQAEAICKDANAKESALGAPGIDWIYSDLFTDLKFLKGFTAVGRSTLDKLAELKPPAEDRAQFATALDAMETMLGGLDKQIEHVRSGKGSGDAVSIYEHGYTDLMAAGGPIGFTECLGVVL